MDGMRQSCEQAQRPDWQGLNVHTTPQHGHFRHNYAVTVPTAEPPHGSTGPHPDRAVPAPLVTAASVVAVEAFVVLALGIGELFSLDEDRLSMGLSTSVFFLAAGAGLAACAWGLWRGRRCRDKSR